MFANFWTGGGDVNLSSARFKDIVQKAKLHGKTSLTVYNGQEAMAQPARFYGTDYSKVFGDATIYYDLLGNPIGFEDTYDFNPYPIRWHSFFNAQLQTEMVDMASWFNFTDKPFKITYP